MLPPRQPRVFARLGSSLGWARWQLMMKSSRKQPRSQGLLRFQDGVDPGNEVELKSFDIHGVFVLPRIFLRVVDCNLEKGH